VNQEAFPTMRAVVQRVKRAEVRVGEEVVGRIGFGLVVLLAVGKDDTEAAGEALAEKIVNLRVFDDDQGKMNRSLLDAGGQALCVSQFTLYGDCRKGRRPSYDQAAAPEQAQRLYESFVKSLRKRGVPTETGRFRAMMDVDLVNDGPVTLLLDSDRLF
jgi:D-aminoacyl-tRNA deacylase